MLKKIVSILLAVVLLLSVAIVSVSAAEDSNSEREEKLVYFDATGWEGYRYIYCYVWERGGDSFYAWQAIATRMTQVSDNLYSYDLSVLEDDKYVEGGMQDGKDYLIIFSSDGTYAQTYDLTLSTECIGDTVYLTGNQIENPVDVTKSTYEAVWTKNSKKYGPHKAITSVGNIVGSNLCPGESGVKVVGDWLVYYSQNPNIDVADVIAKALPEFGVETAEDVQAVYTYIREKQGTNLTDSEYADIEKILKTASGTEDSPSEDKEGTEVKAKKDNKMKVTVKDKKVKAKKLKKAKVTVNAITVKKANGAVTYKKVAKKSSNRLTIDKKTGKITVKKKTTKGNYKIQVKITAKGDKNYKSKTVTKTVKIKVN